MRHITKMRSRCIKTAVEIRTAKGHNMVLKLANYLAGALEYAGFNKTNIHVAEVDLGERLPLSDR